MLVDQWISLGVTQKEVAEKHAEEFRKNWELEQAGMLPPKTLRDAADRLLAEHLEDFLLDLRNRGKAGRNNEGETKYRKRISTILKEVDWKKLKDITPDSFIHWRNQPKSLKPQTINHYFDALNTFINWLVKIGRLGQNPLKHIAKVKVTEKRKRRALSDAELAELTASAPAYRSLVYLVAARTGLRRTELSLLTWGDFILTPHPHLKARESTTKNSKEGFVPLMPEVEQALKNFRPENWQPEDLIFVEGIPRADVLAKDLKDVGIPYCDSLGRYADFHALRVTWCTFLQVNGIYQREAMELMRHNDERLTSIIYTDVQHFPLFEKVRQLPPLPQRSQIRSQICGKGGILQTKRDNNNDGNEGTLTEVLTLKSPSQSGTLTNTESHRHKKTTSFEVVKLASPRGFEPRSLE